MRTLERSVGTPSATVAAASASWNGADDVAVGSATAFPDEELLRLLDAAAAMEDADDRQFARLRSAASRTTRRLVAAGVLPSALAVGDTDPPVVVARLLSRGWRHTARSR